MKELLFIVMVIFISITSYFWTTHIIYSLKNKEYLMLIVGTILPPLGMIHGLNLCLEKPLEK
jgi:uncharacterized protein YebE (UPF0316 family)